MKACFCPFFLCAITLLCSGIASGAPFEFGELDINGDGVLSGSEARSVASYDEDGDGEVSQTEFKAGRQAHTSREVGVDRTAAEAAFRALDGNKDDRLSGTEIKGFEAMDGNQDQRITLEEYLAATVKQEASETTEYVIAVPADTKLFVVEKGELVRLLGRGIAGSDITAKISGPAKLIRTAYRRQVIAGETPIGGEEKEFEFQATGKGQVTVTITVELPTGGKPQVTVYRFSLRDENAVSEPQ